jgi:hypothetical protein
MLGKPNHIPKAPESLTSPPPIPPFFFLSCVSGNRSSNTSLIAKEYLLSLKMFSIFLVDMS